MLASLLLWIHFISLAVGGAATFGMPVLGAALQNAVPEGRPALAGGLRSLSVMGRAAMTLLILTGLALVWLGPGLGGVGVWFWVKMGLVILLIVGIVLGSRFGNAAQKGHSGAAARAAAIGKVNIALLAGILLAAVLAFN